VTVTTNTTEAPSPSRDHRHRRTALRLGCGVAAGALFPGLSFAQAFTRPGFDLRRHAISALTLGDLGWLQRVNFMLSGLLAIAAAAGLRRAMAPGRIAAAGPILVAIFGLAMIGGGNFVPDPAFGWPAGAPAGLPDRPSLGNTLHTVVGATAFMSLIVAGVVFALRFARDGSRTWAWYSAANGVTTLLITTPPWGQHSLSIRFAVGAVLIGAWLAAVSWRFRSIPHR
jgi:hypothetical membrane protein